MKKIIALFIPLFFSCAKDHNSLAKENTEDPQTPIIISTIEIVSSKHLSCPEDMVEVEGNYCPNVEEKCLKWLDPTATNGGEGPVRCAEFAPSKCLSKNRKHLNFCVDKYEFPNIKGSLPQTNMTWTDAKNSCEEEGKRLCQDYEWTFSCEGEDMKPYPYGDGLHRDSSVCNIDKPWIDPWKNSFDKVDQRVVSGSLENCGNLIKDQAGNVDEWVVNSSGKPYISGLKGGHWAIGARNRCRPETISHENTSFKFYETGTRCCKNINQ